MKIIPSTEEIVQYLKTQPPGRTIGDMKSYFKIDSFYFDSVIRQLESQNVIFRTNGYVALNSNNL